MVQKAMPLQPLFSRARFWLAAAFGLLYGATGLASDLSRAVVLTPDLLSPR